MNIFQFIVLTNTNEPCDFYKVNLDYFNNIYSETEEHSPQYLFTITNLKETPSEYFYYKIIRVQPNGCNGLCIFFSDQQDKSYQYTLDSYFSVLKNSCNINIKIKTIQQSDSCFFTANYACRAFEIIQESKYISLDSFLSLLPKQNNIMLFMDRLISINDLLIDIKKVYIKSIYYNNDNQLIISIDYLNNNESVPITLASLMRLINNIKLINYNASVYKPINNKLNSIIIYNRSFMIV